LRAFIDFPEGEDAPGRRRASFTDPLDVLTAWHTCEVEAVLRHAQAHAQAGRWCLGALAYEAAGAFDGSLPTHEPLAGWPLARFAVFEHALPWPEIADGMEASQCTPWNFSMPREVYGQKLEQARAAMAAGECYQVNLAGTLTAEFSGDVAQWMARMQAGQPGGYLLWLDWGEQQVLSASPELFFEWHPEPAGGRLVCKPMKGTAPRHADAALDSQAREELLQSGKERAENVMIVDLLRNDVGRIAQPGTVRVPQLFEPHALPTVWQMTSTVTARTRPEVGLPEIFGALFPCGSVTGAPKARAMHWIRRLEEAPRGIYCGAAGVLRPGGAATFNVPIRTTMLDRRVTDGKPSWSARYGVGSAVTFYANAQDEWQELAAKARVLERSTQAFDLLETLRLEDGGYWLLDEHLVRMARSASYFGFAWDGAEVRELLRTLAQRHPARIWRVRLTLPPSGRGDAQAFALAPSAEPLRFALATRPLDTRAAAQEFVVHKTTRRDHYESRMRPEAGLFDTLLVNERGELTEFTRGNVALRINGEWLTPALHCGLLPGTLRADLLGRGRIAEAVLTPADLERAQDVVFFNSVRGWLRAQHSGEPMDIQLNFINNSSDLNNSEVVIFQKNVATNFDEQPIAWQVIRHCGQGDNHPFTFPMKMQVSANDSYGNYTPQLDAQNGQMFKMQLTTSGDQLVPAGSGSSSKEVQVLNALAKGAINANIYKAGKLLATKTSIAPMQKAVFQFKPTIWIGAVSQVVQGQVMNSAILSEINTELSLLGIASADIVMTGGGPGRNAAPFAFNLENVVMA
jgi:para-aminobenzoate synthetase / 4-amino-4-deoxychorismate lyase